MILRPCSACLRHIAIDERACPFCGVRATAIAPRARTAFARLSRAAVFAGAAACYSSTPEAQHAAPPSGSAVAQGRAAVRGVFFDGDTPVPNATVSARLLVTPYTQKTAVTDAGGRFVITDLPPGTYEIHAVSKTNQHEYARVNLSDGGEVRVTLRRFVEQADPYGGLDDPDACCKPYGAPPARRRVV